MRRLASDCTFTVYVYICLLHILTYSQRLWVLRSAPPVLVLNNVSWLIGLVSAVWSGTRLGPASLSQQIDGSLSNHQQDSFWYFCLLFGGKSERRRRLRTWAERADSKWSYQVFIVRGWSTGISNTILTELEEMILELVEFLLQLGATDSPPYVLEMPLPCLAWILYTMEDQLSNYVEESQILDPQYGHLT